MIDVIELRGLRLLGRCGVLPHEREHPQPLEVDLDLEVDLEVAAASDELDDTIDYAAVVTQVADVVVSGHHALLEHLAGRIAESVLGDPRVLGVTVGVRKLRPPVPEQLDTAGVRLTRRR